jgi:thiamine biosynthesis lipoprotein
MTAPTSTTPPRRAWVERIMGLPVSVHLRGPDVGSAAVAGRVEAVFAELRAMDALFSTYRTDSEISRLNRGELTPADCAPVVREVIGLCERARSRTAGSFDARRLPLSDGGVGFDPSGLVKGWAVERAACRLTDLPDHDLCLNAGGDVLLRAAPGRPPWRIGVEDPAAPTRLLGVLTLGSGAVATSGPAHRGAHIVDPRSGRPAGAVRSVTVTGPELLWADVYATAAVAHGPAALSWLERIDGYEALLVDRAGARLATANWTASSSPTPQP